MSGVSDFFTRYQLSSLKTQVTFQQKAQIDSIRDVYESYKILAADGSAIVTGITL
jgi:hypothetical protein